MSELIPVSKGDQYIEVHPATLAQHKSLGWIECERRGRKADKNTPATDELDDMDVEQLRVLAKERGIAVHHAAGEEKIKAALRAAGEQDPQ